ncbi:MAG: helix-turn-helix domain-containing protein [Acidobacteria bacterium]|nr:helix-turn-helix domain-containing protein [Acidobacteriota bacterium]
MSEGNKVQTRLGDVPAPELPRGLIDVDQLARHLSIAKGTVYNWVYLRRIPFLKVGRCVRFDLRKVMDSLASTTMDSAGKR